MTRPCVTTSEHRHLFLSMGGTLPFLKGTGQGRSIDTRIKFLCFRIKPLNNIIFKTFVTFCEIFFFSTKSSGLRDRPFNLQGERGRGIMVFCFVQNFFFGQHKTQEEYFFFVSQRPKFFFQNLTLGYMTKTRNQIFFPFTKIIIFFSATLGIRIFF